MFNLVTMPDPDNPNNLLIEPYSDVFITNTAVYLDIPLIQIAPLYFSDPFGAIIGRLFGKTKIFNNCDHSIPVEGISLGLSFLKKNLL